MHTSPALSVAVVLDTNVVLDLWLFQDVGAAPLRAALEEGRLHALFTPEICDELADVLQRPFAAAWPTPAAQVLAALQGCGTQVNAPPSRAPVPPRCSDTDDQKFIDLAWHTPAAWLLSRDRAVLKLARAARTRGLQIVTPAAWCRLNPHA